MYCICNKYTQRTNEIRNHAKLPIVRVPDKSKRIFLGQNGLKKTDPEFKSFITQRIPFEPQHNQFPNLDVCAYIYIYIINM